MLLWQICYAGNNKPYVGLHVNTRGCIETKECSFAYGLILRYNLAKQIVMTDK